MTGPGVTSPETQPCWFIAAWGTYPWSGLAMKSAENLEDAKNVARV
jgi:hypothetical protein